ncbi:MAG: anion permease, partial [Selenomonas sp.]|nr:anion permease [Selenomonas sp.]
METLAAIIFVVMYMVIVSEKIHRTVAAMIGAVLMMLLGILSQEVALHHVDFETLGLLVGMMVLVGVTKETGLFDYVAIKAAKSAQAEPRRILVYLCVITAVFSAFLDNVTTVLLMVPVTFSITKILKLDPMPYLLTQIIASNIGGTATLIGDPPNIMIGSAVKELTFAAFIDNLALISILNLILVTAIFVLLYRKKLKTKPELKSLV